MAVTQLRPLDVEKLALAGPGSAPQMPGAITSKPALGKPKALKAGPQTGDYLPSFTNNSAAASQRGPTDRLEATSNLGMPT